MATGSAECCAQVVQASGKQSRQPLPDREKNKKCFGAAVPQSNVEFFFKAVALRHSHVVF